MGTTKITAEPGSLLVAMEREFDAPRDLVFKAHMDPELLVQWLGPRRLTMTVDRYDVRDGGTWRYIHRDTDGTEHGFHGVFHGQPTPDTAVQTFEYEGYPGHVSLDTAVFEDRGDKTLVRINTVFQSVEDRDGMIASGMESGMNEGYERLDELLARLTVPVA
ncbi:MAG TPA: SRPBCC family protein [Candidatus Limnocylindrales bacterium]|nr:SRPBCC family protein [Candidatus Limnocylindrales bacterium]